jgi:hypothetical protein
MRRSPLLLLLMQLLLLLLRKDSTLTPAPKVRRTLAMAPAAASAEDSR